VSLTAVTTIRAVGDPAEELHSAIAALDPTLFSTIESQTSEWDRRALLALHDTVADRRGTFNYLEIGSYRGGSLQVVMRDPRCRHVLSIDPRPAHTADARGGSWVYGSSTEQMRSLLRELPGVDMRKLTTFEADSVTLRAGDLPVTPDLCFIDGEHTREAVLRDARFCAQAMPSGGVIAFHDYDLIAAGIRDFVREAWDRISHALAFRLEGGGGVFALELGEAGLLRCPVVDRVVGSRWHSATWRVTSCRGSATPFLLAWSVMPMIDVAVLRARGLARR
jgi:hypothetical protein